MLAHGHAECHLLTYFLLVHDLFHCVMFVRSKALLLSFLQSEKVSSILESFYINQILDFLRNHVFPHEELYARCYFLGVRAMDAYSNTPHEGTNNGAKYCENRVDPTMSQAESTKRLTEQDQDRAKTKRRQVADSFHKTQLHSSRHGKSAHPKRG